MYSNIVQTLTNFRYALIFIKVLDMKIKRRNDIFVMQELGKRMCIFLGVICSLFEAAPSRRLKPHLILSSICIQAI